MKTISMCASAVIILLMAGCRCGEEKREAHTITVEVATAKTSTSFQIYNAIVIPHLQKELSFDMDGEISYIVAENKKVKKDELLAELKAEKLQKSYDSLQRINSTLLKKLKRHEKLLQIDDISQREYEKIEKEYNTVDQQIKELKQQFTQTRILAPMDGITGKSMVSKGENIKSGESVVSFIGEGANRIFFSVPTSHLKQLQNSGNISFRAVNDGNQIAISAIEIFPTPNGNMDIVAHIDSINYQKYIDILTIEKRGTITDFGSGEQKNVLIPSAAIITDAANKASFVWVVVSNNTVKQRIIKPGSMVRETDISILEGLEGNEKIVINPPAELKEDQQVTIK